MSVGRFVPIVRALNEAGVNYVIVGGVATNLLGHVRATLDLDLIVAFETENLERLRDALKKVGYVPRVPADPRGLADEATRKSWQERNMIVYAFVSMANPPTLVDIFIQHPIPYPDLYARSEVFAVDGEPLRVCSMKDLIYLKELASRPQDLDDIRQLRAAHELSAD